MNLTIQIRTPLWTGGVETGRMDRIHETNIIGSLRWWCEAIVRGLGGDVCNPTSDNLAERCPRNNESYCDVCRVFGATGLRRAFRLRMGSGVPLLVDSPRNIPLPSGRIHKTRKGSPRAGGWYLMGESVTGAAVPLEVIPLSSVDIGSHLRPVLALIDRYAAIGAKVSNGYGVVNILEDKQPIEAKNEDLDALSRAQSQLRPQHTLPDIRDFFFAKIRFNEPANDPNWWQNIRGISEAIEGRVTGANGQVNVYRRNTRENEERCQRAGKDLQTIFENGLLAIAPAVRNWLRFQWFQSLFRFRHAPKRLEDYIFGSTRRQNNMASKINVSHAYRLENGQWELRVWGWIPCQTPEGLSLNRDDFLQSLRSTLEDAATWRWIFNASWPTPQVTEWHALTCDQSDGMAYLKELLSLSG